MIGTRRVRQSVDYGPFGFCGSLAVAVTCHYSGLVMEVCEGCG